MASLFVVQGRNQGSRFELQQPRIRLGRDSDNDIQLHDSEVSRHHVELLLEAEGNYRIRDLGSSNGTYLNAKSVADAVLRSGDQIQLGGTLLLYTGNARRNAVGVAPSGVFLTREAAHPPRILSKLSPLDGESSPRDSAADDLVAGHLRVVYDTALAVSHTLDIDQLLHRLMELIFDWVQADRGCVMLLDQQTKELIPKVRKDRSGTSEDRLVISRTILDFVSEHEEGVRTSDAREDGRWDPAQSIVQHGVREAICVPMRGRYGLLGLIYIDTTTSAEEVLKRGVTCQFSDDHLKLMVSIAHQAALAVEDTSYYSALVQAERLAAVGQTIAMLSHHIKNILQGVRGASFLIDDGLKRHDEEVVRKGWRMVERNQEKIYNLVMDMLTFSKEREPELIPGDLRQVAQEVVELMQVRANELHVQLVLQPGPPLPTTQFDPEGMHRALLNVVINALDACRDRPDACVKVFTVFHAAEQTLAIRVEDNGEGIAAEDLEKLFQLFFSRKGGRGTGLGLTVSHKILREHGGQIQVESKLGAGSSFTLEIPLTAGPNQTMRLDDVLAQGQLRDELERGGQTPDDSRIQLGSAE